MPQSHSLTLLTLDIALSLTHWHHKLGALCPLSTYEGAAGPDEERGLLWPLTSSQAWAAVKVIARHSTQLPVAVNLIYCSLTSPATGLDFFSRLFSPLGALLCLCQTRQGSIGDPKIDALDVRDWNSSGIFNGHLAHICACFTAIYTENLLTL